MRNWIKIIGILSLIIIMLLACITTLIGGASLLWFRTYQVFTERTSVAEVTISELKHDDIGDYADVKVQQISKDSALSAVFGQADSSKQILENEQDFKIYGDTIYVGGPIIKFKDPLILINFKTMYKLGKIYGRYDLNNELEINKSEAAQQQSSYDLNGGYADWKSLFDNINSQNLLGKFYSLFVDTSQISSAGVFVSGQEQNYTVYITNLGFLWSKE